MPRRVNKPKLKPKPVQVLYKRPMVVADEDGMRRVRLHMSSNTDPDAYQRQLKATFEYARRVLKARRMAEYALDASIQRAQSALGELLEPGKGERKDAERAL